MSTIAKYLTREILKYLGFLLAAVIALYLVVDFFDRIDNFIDADLPPARMLHYLILQIPLIVVRITPVGLMLAILVALGLMSRNNEILALKTCGLNPRTFFRPIIAVGLGACLGLFIISEALVPLTTGKANLIWQVEVKKRSALATREKNIWIAGHRSIYFVSYFNPKTLEISGVTLNFFDDQFNLVRRVDARKGKFESSNWHLFDIMEQRHDPETVSQTVEFHESGFEALDFVPDDLKRAARKSEEMNVFELADYIDAVESEGYDATPYRVEFHAKFALPIACLILGMIGTAIALKRGESLNLAVGIAVALLFVFLFWVVYSFCLSLGYGGMLPAPLAAWIANVIFACLGTFGLLNVE
jgi:lipopolysaccharide export system permease protein